MTYCTQSDLELAVGGASALVQLLDKTGDGVADPAMVAAVLSRAQSEVDSAIQVAVQLPLVSVPDSLRYVTADIAAYYSYLSGTTGQAVPDPIKARYDNALRWLDQVATRTRALGASTRPTGGQLAEQIDRNSDAADLFTPTWESTKRAFW